MSTHDDYRGLWGSHPPLSLSSAPKCHRCDGLGSRYNEADEIYVKCGACDGTGRAPSQGDKP